MKRSPKRRRTNRCLNASHQAPTFESLEPRLLLSADSADITLLTTPLDTAQEGQTVNLSASYTGNDINDLGHTLSVNWGDGSDPTSTTDMSTPLAAEHVYADEGEFSIIVTIADENGAEGSLTQAITVTNADPSVVISGDDAAVAVGSSMHLTAAATDPGVQDIVSLSWDITLNDTSVASGTGETISYSPTEAGDYLVTVTATDNDGGASSATSTVTVVPNELTLTVTGDDTLTEGSETTVTLTVEEGSGSGTETWGNTSEVVGDTTSPINDNLQTRCSYLWQEVDPTTGEATGKETLYFARLTDYPTDNTDRLAIYSATRLSTDAAFGPATMIYGIVGNHVSSPWVSKDGLRLYVYRTTASDPVGTQLECITRTSTNDTFNPNNVNDIEIIGTHIESGHYYDPLTGMFIRPENFTLSSDELTIIFDGAYNYDLYMATRTSIGDDFSNITRLERDSSNQVINNVNLSGTSNREMSPSLSQDGLTLYFTSNRNGGTYHIYRTTRASTSDAFGDAELVNIDGFTDLDNLNYCSLSPDGQSLYFQVGTTDTDKDLYVAELTTSGTGLNGDATVTIDWGDGTIESLVTSETTLDLSHTYADNGTYQQTYTVSDGTTGGTVTWEVAVANVAPTITTFTADNASINEGGSVTVTGTVTDPGTLDTHTVNLNWGDGTTEIVFVDPVSRSFTAEHQYLDDGVSGTAQDDVTITAVVTDKDGGTDTASTTVTVANVAPTLEILGLPSLTTEGETFTLTGQIADPGTQDTYSYTWVVTRDGQEVLSGSESALTLTAEDNGQYVVTLTVEDDDTGSVTTSASMLVLNVAPLLGGLALSATSIDENGEVTVSGTVSDPGILDTHTATIDWGNGTTETIAVADNGSFSATMQYLDDNPTATPSDTVTINVTVVDKDGGTVSDSLDLVINNVAPTAGITGIPTDAAEGDTINLSSVVTDPGTADTFTYAWSVTLGQDVVATGSGADFSFVPADNGNYAVTLTVTDDDGGSGTVTENIAVANVDPVITSLTTGASSVGAVAQGETTTIRVELTDAGTADTHTVTVDLGDGNVVTVATVNGVAEVSHAYAQGGIFTVTATVTDDDGGTATQQALSVITGISLNSDGVLNIVGTSGQDVVLIRQLGSRCNPDRQTLAIGANFIPGRGIGWMLVDRSLVQRIVILAGDGDDRIHVSGNVDVSCLIDGGDGNDYLRGGANGDVLLGDEGYDLLWGGGGNDILIGGEESDLILGGSGEDILIDGSTVYDIDDSNVMVGFDDALVSLLDEWNSDGTYEERLSNIQNGGGENGLYVLDDSTLIADQGFDILIGCSGQDWLSYFCDDSI